MQIKNKKRVKNYGEVFTNEREVKAMCDLIPHDIWEDITKTFLEPSCGNGNFLFEILDRKLKYCKTEKDKLIALNSIYGIDILQDNVNESKNRLRNLLSNCNLKEVNKILDKNIICGNSLEIMKKWENLSKDKI